MSLKWRKKPVVIEAFQWTADANQEFDPEWIINAIQEGTVSFKEEGYETVSLVIKTLEGDHIATRGDYIIRGVKGELYPCKPEIFHLTYEPVGE